MSSSISTRRAQRADVPTIEALIGNDQVECITKFGQYSIPYLIETSSLAVVAIDDSAEIVGFATFLDAPPHGLEFGDTHDLKFSDLAQERWAEWFLQTFDTSAYGVHNTVWMNFFFAKAKLEVDVGENVLQTAFSTLPYLEAILGLMPLDVKPFSPVTEMFDQLPVLDPDYYGPKAYHCPRNFFIPSLSIRSARIEDHDDLVPIFDQQSEVLTDIYGEFFLAELIESQNEHNQSLVAEVNGRAVGLMSLTDEIDTRLLQECFDLSLYDNLQKVEDLEAEESVAAPVEQEDSWENAPGVSRLKALYEILSAGEAAEMTKTLVTHVEDYIGRLQTEIDTSLLDSLKGSNNLALPAFVTEIVSLGKRLKDSRFEVTLLSFLEACLLDGGSSLPNVTAVISMEDEDGDGEKSGEENEEEDTFDVEGTGARPSVRGGVGRSSSSGRDSTTSGTVFPGQNNCFSITLFCIDEAFESRGVNFLEHAFSLYPDREYCLLTMPHTAEEGSLMGEFTVVPPLPNNNFSHMLYILHRDSHGTEVALEWANEGDLESVQELMAGTINEQEIVKRLGECVRVRAEALDNPSEELSVHEASALAAQIPQAGFVVTCMGQVVGALILEEQQEVEELCAEFATEDFIKYEDATTNGPEGHKHLHANLLYFVLNPLFNTKLRFLMREALRLYRKHALYYRATAGALLQDVTHVFVQVRPRRRPHRPSNGLILVNGGTAADDVAATEAFANADNKVRTEPLYALHVLTRRLLSQPKATINTRVVVVGASDTALSVLESLLLVPDLNYTNITLLSSTGLPVGRGTDAGAAGTSQPRFLPWALQYDNERMQKLSIESRVRIIADVLVDINCDSKTATLADGSTLPYDLLLLTPGLQDQTRSRMLPDDPDVEGVFTLSNEDDVVNLQAYVDFMSPTTYVVYGCSLNAVCAINGLLDIGISPSSIIWAHQEPEDYNEWCGGDKDVLDMVLQYVHKLGLKIMPGMELVQVGHANNHVTHIQLKNISGDKDEEDEDDEDDDDEEGGGEDGSEETRKGKVDLITLECQVLVGCDKQDVGSEVFEALTSNSLVYDGRTVVNADFQTADPNVFVAGRVAKFSRRYGITLPHESYASTEVGQRCAESILQQMDPASDQTAATKVPTLGVTPLTQEARVPGGLHYFTSQKPSLRPVLHPKVLVSKTNDCLCKLVFDDLNVLRSITYVGQTPVYCRDLANLVGMPSTYMNRILHRYAQDEIPNLIEFLQAPWATTLYHESFSLLRANVHKSLTSHKDDMGALVDQVWGMLEGRMKGDQVDPSRLSSYMEDMPEKVKEMVQIRLLKFLELHANHLPHMQIPAAN